MPDTVLPLSAVVICLNESNNIARCIRSLKMVTDDIVVVDSGSTDDTVAIAMSLGARVVYREWTGYSAQKNYGNTLCRHRFVLSLDADECLGEELAHNIRKEMLTPTHDAYTIDFLTAWKDKIIRFGAWAKDRHCCLFDRYKIGWNTDGVHEGLALNGIPVKHIPGVAYHYTTRDRMEYRAKMSRYARAFADHRKAIHKHTPVWKKYTSTIARFCKDYILKGGFLEGQAGWQIAFEEARYTFLKYKWSE